MNQRGNYNHQTHTKKTHIPTDYKHQTHSKDIHIPTDWCRYWFVGGGDWRWRSTLFVLGEKERTGVWVLGGE